MKLFSLFFLIFLCACGAPKIKNDRSPLADVEAHFESVMTKVGSERRIGNGVYVFDQGSEISHLDLEIFTVFEGTYHIRAQSCFVDWPGRYVNSEVIRIPIVNFLNDTSENKTCTITVQVSPTLKDSEVTIFPRYSVIVLTVSDRDHNAVSARQMRMGTLFEPIKLDPTSSGNYQVVRKCVYEQEAQKIGPFPHEGFIALNSSFLSENLFETDANGNPIPIEDFTKHLGNCYFSVLYSDDTGITKYAISINVFKKDHIPLQLSVKQENEKVEVNGPDRLYVCKIDSYHKLGKSKCSRDLDKLPSAYTIQGHTNKRSAYILVGEQ